MTTVLLVDDHPVVRSGLRAVLDAAETLQIVGEAATGEEALALAAHLRPDVVLCDLRPTFERDAEILGAIEAGAAGYLLKEVDPDVIIDGIQRAAAGDTVLAPDLASRVLKGMRSPLPRLTDREIDVLRLLATGSANKEIARALFVTEATVKSHLVHIFTKLGVDSRSRAIHVAQETGLI